MVNRNNNRCIIVGGGPVGILCSILLSEKYENVLVIEKSNILGGLLNSCQDELGNHYDIGTHVPNVININALDDILFGEINDRKSNWLEYNCLPTQTYFNGKWNRKSSLIDAQTIGKVKYERGIIEFFHANEKYSKKDNLTKITTETYGPTFTKEIFSPITKKLYGVSADELETQGSLDYFGLGRLVMLNPDVTNHLKKIQYFDKKIGFHTNTGTELIHYYPKSPKGCRYWIDSLVEKAKKKNVLFKTNVNIDKINITNDKIESIEIKETGEINCDLVVWTIPPYLAFKAAGIDTDFAPPTLRTTTLFHYYIDKELLIKDAFYVWCMDPKYKSFRITLYPNLNPKKHKSGYTITSEILSDKNESKTFNPKEIFKELISLGIVDTEAKVLSATHQVLHNTFPVPKIGFMKNIYQISEKIQNDMSNLLLFGRSKGSTWFMTDVFKDAYETINNI